MTDEERGYEDKGGWIDVPYFRLKRGGVQYSGTPDGETSNPPSGFKRYWREIVGWFLLGGGMGYEMGHHAGRAEILKQNRINSPIKTEIKGVDY